MPNVKRCIDSGILYAAETITWKPQLVHHIAVFENHIMRFMCGKRLIDNTSIADLLRTTGLQPIMQLVRKRKLSWYGRVKRSSLPVKVAVGGMVPRKRSRGRPKRRWCDDIYEWTGKRTNDLNILVKDRRKWKELVARCYNA